MQKRYVLIGASGRALYMYAQPIVNTFSHCAKVVGIYDINTLRCQEVVKQAGLDCPIYEDVDQMLAETKPDAAIITTVDRFHHEYAIKCMEAGIDVISEKPMTIDPAKCRALLECEKRTGKKLTITFNYRYTPYVTAIKQALKDGAVGEILNVDFEYLLDTSHGADYFRRWHRKKENSGGLLVHKSTHHFDMVNWWIDEEPEEVMAFGTRRFYGPTRENRGERCLTCEHKTSCEFYYDITKDSFGSAMYLNCESADGYFRDRCVFADEIDIEDTMSVNVRYSSGALLSYSLIAHSPYEGWKIAISGTKGRLEAAEYHSGMRTADPAFSYDIYDRSGAKITYTVPKSSGGHGGGDARLLKMLFEGNVPDPLGHAAGSYAGAVSILIGISANTSIAEHRNVRLAELVPLADYRR
ncbi:MAG: Gfo/Idh/MocA family protein [Armatimonadota bacterium]